MIEAFIYRYPHPTNPGVFLYVGQERKEGSRDKAHRSAKTPFGRRFIKKFPNTILPLPIRRKIYVEDFQTINEEETIDIFRFHAWYAYGGMNLTLPSSQDYLNAARLGGIANITLTDALARNRTSAHQRKAGKLGGAANRINCIALGHLQGKINVENGHLKRIRTPDHQRKAFAAILAKNPNHQSEAGKAGGRKTQDSGQLLKAAIKGGTAQAPITNCLRWNIQRNKPCSCGKHLGEI